jgi:hypothetical protein
MADLETRSIVQLDRAVVVPDDAYVPVQSEDAPARRVPVSALFSRYLGVAATYPTLAELEADLDHAEDALALVFSDPDPTNSIYYRKSGASGAGSWERTNMVTGSSGPANSTYTSTAALEAAAVTNVSAILAEAGKAGTFTVRDYADFTAEVAADIGKVNYIRSTVTPARVWVRASILAQSASLTGKSGSGTVQDTISLLEGMSVSPQVDSLFIGDGSTARHGAVLNLAGTSASQNEIGFSVAIDNAVLVGGGKSYSVGLFAAQTSRAGSCTGYGLNTIFRSYGPPGTSIEANTDNFGPDSGNLVTQNSVFGAYAWITGINILIAGTGNVLAGLVIGSPPAYVKKINRGILIDGDCIRLNGIEDTSDAPTAYMIRGAKGVGIDTTNATFSSNRALFMAAGHFLSWMVGGTPQDVLGVSGTDFQIGYGVARTLFGSSMIPGADNAFALGSDAERVSRLTAVELKNVLQILVAAAPPSDPPAGQCYFYMDSVTGKATIKDAAGVAHALW